MDDTSPHSESHTYYESFTCIPKYHSYICIYLYGGHAHSGPQERSACAGIRELCRDTPVQYFWTTPPADRSKIENQLLPVNPSGIPESPTLIATNAITSQAYLHRCTGRPLRYTVVCMAYFK